MIVLALDSSAEFVSVALLRDGEPVAERSRRAILPRSEGLLAAIDGALADAAVTVHEIGLVATATGPGSFNGVRGGIATAEGLALALGIDAVGVSTLDAMAYLHAGRAPRVCAVLPAGRGEYYGASYEGWWHEWRRGTEYAVGPLAGFLAGLPAGALLCGNLPPDAVALASGAGVSCAPAHTRVARATAVAALALQRLGMAHFDRRASLQPVYLRRPGVTQPARSLSAVSGPTESK